MQQDAESTQPVDQAGTPAADTAATDTMTRVVAAQVRGVVAPVGTSRRSGGRRPFPAPVE